MAQNDPTLSRTNLEMVTIASEYCNLIENCSSQTSSVFLQAIRGFAPLLYLRGSLIRAIEPEFPEANERFVTEEQWDGIFTGLRELLGNQDEFLYMGYSEFGEQTTLTGSLSEHLADVYQDMKDFIILFKRPSLASRENAIYECAHLFQDRWGARLSVILPVIHQLTVSNQTDTRNNSDDFPGIY